MPRSALAIIGALLIAGALFLVFRSKRSSRVPEPPSPRIVAPAASTATEPIGASAAGTEPTPSGVLPDGRKVPELPADAPKSVSFGVVLVTYRGAEGAPSDARTKESALAKAKELLPDARRDFAEATRKGDRGSTAQAGSMPRGVLEPGLEYILFTLKKGEVYGEPLDTPRGYWLLRRGE